MSLENFLYKKKFNLILLIIIFLVSIILIVFFSWSVAHIYEGGSRLGKFGKIALNIATIPSNLKKIIEGKHAPNYDLRVLNDQKNLNNVRGFYYSEEAEKLKGYLLISNYNGDTKRSEINILDLEKKKIIHKYNPKIEIINNKIPKDENKYFLKRDHNKNRYRIINPLIDGSGNIIFNSIYSPLVKINACSEYVWHIPEVFHHSNEFDADGNIWSPGLIIPSNLKGVSKNFKDDGIYKISPSGEIIFKKSLTKILIENDLDYLFGKMFVDPLHLNDIQPALNDTTFWKKNDLFLSIRNLSLVLLYRPSTNKIIWFKQYPWIYQHDIDIINNEEISIFNNNLEWNKIHVKNNNNILIYNFRTDEVSEPFKKIFKKNNVATSSEGLVDFLNEDLVMVDESPKGRLLILEKNKKIFEFINNDYEDNHTYYLNWSRYLDEGNKDKIKNLNNLKSKCSIQ
jgi:hypothetical protein